MAGRKKTYKIKRGRPKLSRKPRRNQNDGDCSDEENKIERPVPEHFKEQTPIKKAVKMDPRAISNLTEEQRVKLRSEHPEMNEYFLMSARQKSKYFHLLNQKYRLEMKLPQPPGSAPMRKTIKFKKRFEIKPFSYSSKCQEIKCTRSFMELYKAKDQSKKRSISKFPRNS